jgi:hypothetical protein
MQLILFILNEVALKLSKSRSIMEKKRFNFAEQEEEIILIYVIVK